MPGAEGVEPAVSAEQWSVLGIELGSRFLKLVALDAAGNAVWRRLEEHRGEVSSSLAPWLDGHRQGAYSLGLCTRLHANLDVLGLDPVVCLHTAARVFQPKARNILEVGASHLTLIRLDGEGRVATVSSNPLCAAGTGSFLDAQARRMGVRYGSLPEPDCNIEPPSIASRCAVFAKSDLVHRQQEGFGTDALWSGLCRGLADSVLATLGGGRPLAGTTLLCGGVARNKTLVAWLARRLAAGNGGSGLIVAPEPDFAAAHGAALLAANCGNGSARQVSLPERRRRPSLILRRSQPWHDTARASHNDEWGNEVRIHCDPATLAGEVAVGLGLDIGSTSTKAVLVDSGGSLLADIYRRTGGDPVGAVQRLFRAVQELERLWAVRFAVAHSAATGSGRTLVGRLVGADLIVNEITAHAAGAMRVDPGVATIIEIGGQDAKFIALQDGRVADAAMNYVCAAGTGSFVEELAAQLGYTVQDVGAVVDGVAPPAASSRCTVFMEQDVNALLRSGVSRREACGAVIYGVIDNYLETVVGRRPIHGPRVFFQGATARNPGLVAALENTLDMEVVVPPHPHAMGAWGAVLLAQAGEDGPASRFRGFDLARRAITISRETCERCSNRCVLTRAEIAGCAEPLVWGRRCGQEDTGHEASGREGLQLVELRRDLYRKASAPAGIQPGRRPRIVLPAALTAHSLLPFWQTVFSRLGLPLEPTAATDLETLRQGAAFGGGRLCLPVRAACGHAVKALADPEVDAVFLPYMIADESVPGLGQTRYCPYCEAVPALLEASPANGRPGRVAAPVIDLRLSDRDNARALVTALAPWAQLRRRNAEKALAAGRAVRRRREEAMRRAGAETLAELAASGRPGLVVVGRAYNVFDDGLNQEIPELIAAAGGAVIPMEALPFRPDLLTGDYRNVFWASGQRIMSALLQVAHTPNLYAVYLSSFGCGPDSFLLSFAEAVMTGKPFLSLELDDHGSSGGYRTRVEAFMDVVRGDLAAGSTRTAAARIPDETQDPELVRKLELCFPPMHPVGARLLAAGFRSGGYNAVTLPDCDAASFAEGRRRVRGSECLPAPLTLGSFLRHTRSRQENGGPPRGTALFMPTADGPCRFGQYRALFRLILDDGGMAQTPIFSPSSENAYHGLDDRVVRRVMEGIFAGDILFKLRCRIAPYQRTRGDAEELLEHWTRRLEQAIGQPRQRLGPLLAQAGDAFARVPVRTEPRPLVGIVGEVFVRVTPHANAQLVETIEALGGEAWLAPVGEWVLYTAWVERYRLGRHRAGLGARLGSAVKYAYLSRMEHSMYRSAGPLLARRREPPVGAVVRKGARYVPPDFEGESIITMGRTVLFAREGVSLVVNCAPFGCMHGALTTALFEQAGEEIGVPVVNVFYDGFTDNSVLAPFLHDAVARGNGMAADRRGDRRP